MMMAYFVSIIAALKENFQWTRFLDNVLLKTRLVTGSSTCYLCMHLGLMHAYTQFCSLLDPLADIQRSKGPCHILL